MARTIAEIVAHAPLLADVPLVPLTPAHLIPTRALKAIPQRDPTTNPLPDWQIETFLVPAAYPRAFPRQTKRANEGRKDLIAGTREEMLLDLYERQTEAGRTQGAAEGEEGLCMAVNRYTRKKGNEGSGEGRGLTLVMIHPNGMHKETWEPTLEDLLRHAERDTNGGGHLPIEEIWSIDLVNHGQSAILNEDVLGETFYWGENGRDLISFVVNYIDSPTLQSSDDTPPTTARHLSPVVLDDPTLNQLDFHSSCPSSSIPTERQYRNRIIVGIGHSVGASALAFASSSLSSLFSSVIFVDPVIVPSNSDPAVTEGSTFLARGAITRTDNWASREEAARGFLKKGFFMSWDERVFDSYMRFGLKDREDGRVGLTMDKIDEARVFADPAMVGAKRAFVRLSKIPTSLPAHFIFADVNKSVLNEVSIKKVLAQLPHATSARIEGVGHLIPQDAPGKMAERLREYLVRLYPNKGKSKL